MLQKILALVIIVAGVIMMVVGIVNRWPRHIIFGAIAVFTGMPILFYLHARSAALYDEKNNRYYKFAKMSDSPHHGYCPQLKCGRYSQVIYTIHGSKHYGIYCEIHGCQWSDQNGPIQCGPILLIPEREMVEVGV